MKCKMLQPSTQETKMKPDFNKQVAGIAHAIVELVERADGPVTLCKVHREIVGFGALEPPFRATYREEGDIRKVLWADMTKAGAQALDDVMFGQRVAVEVVDALPHYFMEGGSLECENWQPIVLLPARAANISTRNGLFRVPPAFLTPTEVRPSWRVLRPAAPGSAMH
jgi:hypothetical protein